MYTSVLLKSGTPDVSTIMLPPVSLLPMFRLHLLLCYRIILSLLFKSRQNFFQIICDVISSLFGFEDKFSFLIRNVAILNLKLQLLYFLCCWLFSTEIIILCIIIIILQFSLLSNSTESVRRIVGS